jgi:hypothetical protein
MKRMKFLALMFCSILTISSIAQNINVSGKVFDEKSNKSMPGATVMLLNPSDSSFYKFSTTNDIGVFSIKGADAGNYILQISFIGYNSYYKDISLSNDKQTVDLGSLNLKTKQAILKTFEVVEEVVPVIINGDTVEFNAAAFKTQPEDNVGDLLKKLPGVEIEKDGTIKAQGEEVKKVLLDGKEFFGDDTRLATDNLPADMVKKVQIYDDFSETSKITGIDDGDRTKTINLKIKKDRKKGLFGNVTVGGGSTANDFNNLQNEDALFNNKFNINKFKENMQLSTLGMLNNTNEQGFSFRDYINFVGGGSNAMKGGRRSSNSSGVPLESNANDGFTTTKSAGVNWNKDFSKKINLSTSYFYNELEKIMDKESEKQYLTDSSDFSSFEKIDENHFNRNHRFKIKYDQKIDSTQDLKIVAQLNLSDATLFSNSNSESHNDDGSFLSDSKNHNESTGKDINGEGSLIYGKRFKKKGRSFVTKLSFGSSDNDKKYFIDANNNLLDSLGLITNRLMRQKQNENNRQINYSGKISVTEPIGHRKYLELSYQRNNYNNDYIKDFFDLPPGQEIFNPNLSLNYTNNYVYDKYQINTKINNNKSKLTTGISVQKSDLDGEITSNNFQLTRVQWNLLPNLKWNYRFNKSSRFVFSYRTNVQEPSLDQLQPSIDNSNPLFVYIGNPNLSSEYNHNITARLMSFNQYSFTNIFAMIRGTYTKNKITDSQMINKQFVQTITPINVDNDQSLSGYIYFGTPIRPIKSKINIRLNSSYNKSILFINAEENDVDRLNNGIDLNIENRNKDVFDVKLGSKISLNTTEYSVSSNFNQEYVSTAYYTEFLVEFLKTWTFSSEIEYTIYSGNQFADNPSIPLWKAYISKRFLKGNSGLIKLAIYDILNQNIGINRISELNYIEDERVATLSRYLILSFTYKIRRFGGKKKKS